MPTNTVAPRTSPRFSVRLPFFLVILPLLTAPGLVAMACSGSSSTAPLAGGDGSTDGAAAGDTGPAGDPNAACASYATALCQRFDTCTGGRWSSVHYADQAACISRTVLQCTAALGAPDTSATPAFFTACAATFAQAACGDVFDQTNTPAACLAAPGARDNGRACSFNAQCKSTWCWTPQGAACGSCADRPAAGAVCVTSADCGGRGLACTKGLVCNAPAAAGGACDDTHECAYGTSCVGQTKTAAGKCATNATTAGAACDAKRNTLPTCQNPIGLYCNVDGQCATETNAINGQGCGFLLAPDAGPPIVDAGPDVTVKRPYTVGACVAGAVCEPGGANTGTCSAPAADNGACDRDNGPPCLAPARCVTGDASTAGTCAMPGAAGCN